jgi:tellurite resistance protein
MKSIIFDMKKECRIKYFPVSFFSIILGLAGFSIAWQKAEKILQLSTNFSFSILVFSSIVFVLIFLAYLVKLFFFQSEVKLEFQNQIKLSFFPTFSISLLLLSIAFLAVNQNISFYL